LSFEILQILTVYHKSWHTAASPLRQQKWAFKEEEHYL